MYLHFIHKDLTFHAGGVSLSDTDMNRGEKNHPKPEEAGRERIVGQKNEEEKEWNEEYNKGKTGLDRRRGGVGKK